MGLSASEENYIKAIFKLSERQEGNVSTNALAEFFDIKPASVTDMVQRLADKKHVSYKKYKGVQLTASGKTIAKQLIRKHRLWEVFLVEKLNFSWDEVHVVAEQLEHIDSDQLIVRLDEFLTYPKFDPHGDPIPDEKGKIPARKKVNLLQLKKGDIAYIVGVEESDDEFLRYLNKVGLQLGSAIEVIDRFDYDDSTIIKVEGEREITISGKVGQNLWLSA